MIANLRRTFGPEWKAKAHDRVHTRLRRLGHEHGRRVVGSGAICIRIPKTPYTNILHVRSG
jgi:hypothetical protein